MVDAAVSFRSDHIGDTATSPDHSGARVEMAVVSGEPALAAYRAACDQALHAPAQSPEWVEAWLRHCLPDALAATISVDGNTILAIALEVDKAGPFRVARLVSGRHANGNFPPVDASLAASVGALELRRLASAIAAARPDIDLIAAERLLPEMAGVANPLLLLPHVTSANVALSVSLHGGFEALLARTSGKRKRKKHRAQTRKFEAAGGYRRIEANTAEETTRLLDAFFAMKEERFRKMGIANVFGQPGVRAFYRAVFVSALATQPKPFVLHGLEVGGVLRAVTGSSRGHDRITCEFGAIMEDDLANASPGDFLFYDNIEEACRQEQQIYDFGVGDEPYKRAWCNIETRHFDVLLPLTAKGRLLAMQLGLVTRAKAALKNSPFIWKIAKLMRRQVAGREQGVED